VEAICTHLQAVTEGRLRNLIINVPPGHAKSLRAGVFWPAWVWIDRPQTRWLFASYAANLSVRDSLKCRRLIESEWYQQNWGHRYQLTSDQNQKHRFENDHTGYRIATSVGGSATGEKGGCGGSRRPTDTSEVLPEARFEERARARIECLPWLTQRLVYDHGRLFRRVRRCRGAVQVCRRRPET
jgi:hypothetical protein